MHKYFGLAWTAFTIGWFASGCRRQDTVENRNSDKEIIPLFELVPATKSRLTFDNHIEEGPGINGVVYEYLYNGGGVAAADFNNDGLTDLYFTANLVPNALYLNQGDLKFQKATAQAGLEGKTGFPTGVTVVDINSDGKMDIYISKSGKYPDPEYRRNELYINKGNNRDGVPQFEEEAKQYGLDLPDYSTQAAFFDFDRDGDLDMFLLNHNIDPGETEGHITELLKKPSQYSASKLFRNDDGMFFDVSGKVGLKNNSLGYGLGVAISDFNNDGWPDILVAMDYSEKDYLYQNNGDGTFTDVMNEAVNHISNASMGNDVADINNDGFIDFISVDMVSTNNYDLKTNMSGMNPERFQNLVDQGLHHQYMFNTLQLNNGNMLEGGTVPAFSDIAQYSGLAATNWSWAPLFMDMDNDGFLDLFVSNGVLRSFRNNDFVVYKRERVARLYKDLEQTTDRDRLIADYYKDILAVMPEEKKENLFYRNNRDNTFSEMNQAWELHTPTATNGAVYVDLDNDGDLDIVGNNVNDQVSLYRNNANMLYPEHHHLDVHLKGSRANASGIGAKVTVHYDTVRQLRENYTSRGFQSAMDRVLHFGLGNAKKVEVSVLWPDGKGQELSDVPVDQPLWLDYKEAKEGGIQTKPMRELLFHTDADFDGLFRHHENSYDDFKREGLLPHKYSQNGPALAVADVNGDGRDDFYIGGAQGQSGQLFLQDKEGGFRTQSGPWEADAQQEDMAAEWLDADGDGDMDLYVVSGGNEKRPGDPYYQDRLYENKGRGKFEPLPGALPELRDSGSCAKAADFDGDGDIDLFVGGKVVPGKYPYPANSRLLRNESTPEGISFTDATAEVAPFLKELGMVSAAEWTDMDADGRPDLVVVGEWMPIRMFRNEGGHFSDKTANSGLEEQTGWWYSLAMADFDGDGDQDILVGNLGRNYKYKASETAPFEVFADDFDNSGSMDIVLGYHEEGKLYPLRGRQCSSQQMPFIKNKFPTYNDFGAADLAEVLGTEGLEGALHYKATTFATAYVENLGGWKFRVRELKGLPQFSSVNTILIDDFDADGLWDAVLAGNLYQAEVETVRNDAGYGVFMKGNGKGGFQAFFPYESGLFVKGDVKQARFLDKNSGKKRMVFAKNNANVQGVSYGK